MKKENQIDTNTIAKLEQKIDEYRKQLREEIISNKALKDLLLHFLIYTKFDKDSHFRGYKEIIEIIENSVKEQAEVYEIEYQERVEDYNTSASALITDIGKKLLHLYDKYQSIYQIAIYKNNIGISLYDQNKTIELCFTILSVEHREGYNYRIHLDSDWASASTNFDEYDSILFDVAQIIYQIDDTYTKNDIDIQEFIRYSDTGQNPLWKS